MKIAVLGNGESRRHLDLQSLKTDHIIVGCNAIHRDLVVDHLVCCDRRMAEEATKTTPPETLIYVREDWYHYFRKIKKNKSIRQVPDLPYKSIDRQDQPFHWGSGPYAILIASLLESTEIHIFGFDLYSSNNKVNNIYKGTENYADPNSQSVDPSYWIYQISKIFEKFVDKKYIIHNNKDWPVPKEWRKNNVLVLAL